MALVVKYPLANAGDTRDESFDLWIGKVPWREVALHSIESGVENSMGRGAWWATVHGVSKSRTRLSD